MKFSTPLIKGTLIKRYKRFLADVTLESGEIITAHTPNTGSMRGCCTPGSRVYLRNSKNSKRKYPLSWEMIEVAPQILVGINTHLSNHLVEEAIQNGVIEPLADYSKIKREVKYGEENSRIDLLLTEGELPNCYVEVKNVTLVEDKIAYFPDAVSARGTKHLRELMAMRQQGHRAVLLFCLQRNDAIEVRPADNIDALYGQTLRQAFAHGVEILAYAATLSEHAITLDHPVPVKLD